MTRPELLAAVRSALSASTEAGDLPALLAELERLRVEAILTAAAPRASLRLASAPSKLLTFDEVAARLNRDVSWVYRHKRSLPVTRFPTGSMAIDSKKLEQWIDGRTKTVSAQ